MIKENIIKTTMYGIANCDTIKKAKKWLEANSIEFAFHDYKKLGIDETAVNKALDKYGIDTVVNKRGTTFRKLSEEEKSSIDESNVIALLSTHTSMIKRPIIVTENDVIIGFNAIEYANTFGTE